MFISVELEFNCSLHIRSNSKLRGVFAWIGDVAVSVLQFHTLDLIEQVTPRVVVCFWNRWNYFLDLASVIPSVLLPLHLFEEDDLVLLMKRYIALLRILAAARGA